MKLRKRNIILTVSLLFVVVLSISVYSFIKYYSFDWYEKEIIGKFSEEPVAYPENYDSLFTVEIEKQISFPKEKPKYAVLHFTDYFKSSIYLNGNQLKMILNILNDSSTFCWGELGTPEFSKFVTFHSVDGKCIGIIKIDIQGQTYAIPHISLMKWGLIDKKTFFKLIKEIEANS